MKAIGGFLDLEVSRDHTAQFHSTSALSTARSCIFFLVQQLRLTRVYVPYYICDVVVRALDKAGAHHRFYGIDTKLEVGEPPELSAGEMLIYVNYFGLKSEYALSLERKYGAQLLVDDSQAFFQTGYQRAWSVNSARKFFGVPDGAYLYGPASVPTLPAAQPGYDHLVKRLVGKESESYRLFLAHEAELDHEPRSISPLSSELLKRIDYRAVAASRRRNYLELHDRLRDLNQLELELTSDAVPLYYPLLSQEQLRQRLVRRKVFVPQLWPEIETRSARGFRWEKDLARRLSPLPIDQRYGVRDMVRVVGEVRSLLRSDSSR